ncbi:uncharacterized protein EI90DRAFT_3134311 [Cantharellus anzutake]|uniref:uncharacterized protein n=1 Tax=Cantharellus anzutake TaxID=1750568 RepID=UPI001906ED3A|nr:uncharacterized protein EI90DRAFT_3134311 [Cantharellus anzutake]KAF8316704.1 hypothetical protein EI90DRAFT_3134311 [Cantharellus anzutake]
MTWEVVHFSERVTGDHHNMRWTVTCKIDGRALGTASGPRKGAAKEEAARRTLLALGVEPR